jgi:hypothetical protein
MLKQAVLKTVVDKLGKFCEELAARMKKVKECA